MDEALEGPSEPGPDPRLAATANMAPYPSQYNVMQSGYNEQFKRMRYDPSYQEQVARQQQYYLVPMQQQQQQHQQQQQQQQQQQRPPIYPSPQPSLMMPHMGPASHLSGPAMSPHMGAPTPPSSQTMMMPQSGPLYPGNPESDVLVKSSSSPALRSPGMLCPSDNSPLSPIKREFYRRQI